MHHLMLFDYLGKISLQENDHVFNMHDMLTFCLLKTLLVFFLKQCFGKRDLNNFVPNLIYFSDSQKLFFVTVFILK